MTGLGDLVPREMQLAALRKIFAFNVMKFGNGEMGAANGMAADGSIIGDNEQAPRGVGWDQLRLRCPDAERRNAGSGLPHGLGLYHVIYETQGILVPNSGSLGREWELPGRDVYATSRNLGDGNDPPA